MKPIRFSNILGQSRTLRSLCLTLAAPALVLTLGTAHAGTPAAATTPAEVETASNWISFGVGGAFVSGDNGAMMRRTQTNGDFYGGIDGLQFSKALDKTTTLSLDGHALPGLEDYLFNLDLQKADIGYVKVGFKQYRTWYDGDSGFLTGQQFSAPAWGDELYVDRGEISFEAGLRMENLPEITFSYKHDYRDGSKDSLAWGSGIPSNIANVYKLMPAVWNLDEKSDTFELGVEHTIGITDLGMGVTYEHASYSNSRTNSNGYATTVTSPPTTNSNAFRYATQTDDYTMDLFAGNIHSTTRFSDKLWVSGGFAYNSVNTDTNGGSRSFTYPYSVAGGARPDSFYTNMLGGGEVEQIIGNLNVMWVPLPDLTVTPSGRFEHENQSGWNQITSYNLDANRNIINVTHPVYATDSGADTVTGALDLRYNGIPDWVFFAKGQWQNEQEDVYLNNADPTIPDWMSNKIRIDEQEYTVGANWYPMSGLSFSLQGEHANREQNLDPNAYNGPGGSQSLQPIMVGHDTIMDDVNLRATWRPLNNLSLVTRYDYCNTQFKNQGITWSGTPAMLTSGSSFILPEVSSGNTVSNILSECITWNPMSRLYLQLSTSWVWSHTSTEVWVVGSPDNDYFSGSLTAGYAIDDKTDITGSITYYGATNYMAAAPTVAAPAAAMGYGFNTQEYDANLTLRRKLSENMVWTLRYGLCTSNTSPSPDQTGGLGDFTAQMISTSLQIRF